LKIDLWVLFKGILMGAADIVPGVSGGTVAFITGIYERLLQALKAILPAFIDLVKSRQWVVFWQTVDGAFLLTLFSGILISVVSLAKIITYLLLHHPIPLWAAFFGLILASVYIIGREITQWSFKLLVFALLGLVIALFITHLTPAGLEANKLTAFLSGVLAICAMVLPGISGSFILVILGTYSFILMAIKEFDFIVLGVFVSGCLVGLLSIANILVWAFSRYKNLTLAVLTGFMVGALSKVWPWKSVLSFREDRHGQLVPLLEENILPDTYEILTGLSSQFMLAILCAASAAILVISLAHFAGDDEK